MTPRGFNEFWSTISPQDNITKVDIVQQLSCKGKFMFIVLDDGRPQNIQTNGESTDYLRSIWITLGMTGYFMNDHGGENSHSRWFMEFLDMTRNLSRRIYFQDPRSFGTIRFSLSRKELMDKLSCLGPDVLDNEFSEEAFLNRLSSKSMELNICKALMDQSVRMTLWTKKDPERSKIISHWPIRTYQVLVTTYCQRVSIAPM
jgi:formamidopyrimidine-DNA glycosylase